MQTSNESLRDDAIKHAVYLRGYSIQAAFDAVQLLRDTEKDIVAHILDAGDTPRLIILLNAIRKVNTAAYEALYEHLTEQGKLLATHEAEVAASAAMAATFDTIKPVIASPAVIFASVIERPFEGLLLKEWVGKLEASRMERVTQAIRMGTVQGESMAQIITRIRGTKKMQYKDGALEMSRRAASALASSYTAHVASAARETVFAANPKVYKGVQWLSTLDNLTCVKCGPLDGKVFKVHEGPRPILHINCRCTTVGITRTWREMGIDKDETTITTRASMNGQVAATETYSTWLAKQPASFQDHVLGKGKGELYRAGMPLEKFTDIRGHELTLKELRAL